jgi:hypothetical protein
MKAKYDHHLFTREKLLRGTSFLEEADSCQQQSLPPANPSAFHKRSILTKTGGDRSDCRKYFPVLHTITMRGARPTNAIEEAQRCAMKMGYHWIKNTDPEWQFDAFMFRLAVIAAIKNKKIRHAIDENAFVEHLFPEEIDALR